MNEQQNKDNDFFAMFGKSPADCGLLEYIRACQQMNRLIVEAEDAAGCNPVE